jgi:hypothetical protein
MAAKSGFFRRFYSTESLFRLFMVCAFPLHLWSLLAAFRDFGWVAARTRVWDAVGLAAYAMAFALLETTAVFLLVLLLGFLVPAKWKIGQRVALMGTLFLVVAAWAILAQLISEFLSPVSAWLIGPLAAAGHPLRTLWGAAFLLVTLTVLLPVLWILRAESSRKAILSAFDNLAILSSFYVILDVIGILVIIARNLMLMLGIG